MFINIVIKKLTSNIESWSLRKVFNSAEKTVGGGLGLLEHQDKLGVEHHRPVRPGHGHAPGSDLPLQVVDDQLLALVAGLRQMTVGDLDVLPLALDATLVGGEGENALQTLVLRVHSE